MRPPLLTAQSLRLALLAGLVALYYGGFCWRPDWMRLLGIDHFGIWFLDTHALLAASDAHALGFEPHGRNPFDLFGQPHVYSNWWFALHSFGWTRVDHVWLGALIGFVFLVVALLALKVRSTGELLWSLACITAPCMVLGFNRGNADLLVFVVLAAIVPLLLSEHRWLRWFSLAPILFATGLKFYPVGAGFILLDPARSRREVLSRLGLFGIFFAALAVHLADDVRHYAAHELDPTGLFTFGAGISAQLLSMPGWMTPVAAGLLILGASVFWWRKAPQWTIPPEEHADYLRFLLGAVLLTVCYFLTINYAYRRVFAIFMMPFLWSAWSRAWWPRWFRRLGRINGGLLMATLWLDGIFCLAINLFGSFSPDELTVWTNRLVLAEQPLVAAARLGLLGFLVPFVRDSLRMLASTAPQPTAVAP